MNCEKHCTEPHGDCGWCHADAIIQDRQKVVAERDHYKTIVDKLPKTADGVPIIPGMTLYTAYNNGKVCRGFETQRDGRLTCLHYVDGFDRCIWAVYSTREAAEAARGK